MSKPSLVIVLCEDQRQRDLIRRYLAKATIELRGRVRFNPEGKCRGSGEQHVRLNYANEVGACRNRQARAQTALIVVVDADTTTVQGRLQQLETALRESGQDPVELNERVAHLIPKRNIETWILCLNGVAVDETIDYKTQGDWSQRIKQAAETLFLWVRQNWRLSTALH